MAGRSGVRRGRSHLLAIIAGRAFTIFRTVAGRGGGKDVLFGVRRCFAAFDLWKAAKHRRTPKAVTPERRAQGAGSAWRRKTITQSSLRSAGSSTPPADSRTLVTVTVSRSPSRRQVPT